MINSNGNKERWESLFGFFIALGNGLKNFCFVVLNFNVILDFMPKVKPIGPKVIPIRYFQHKLGLFMINSSTYTDLKIIACENSGSSIQKIYATITKTKSACVE